MNDTLLNRIPIKQGLFTWPAEQPRLIASKCLKCGAVSFPVQDNCPACAAREIESIHLSPRGKLWTWTIQSFMPPSPPYIGKHESFKPFGVGYIELPEGIRVESRLTVSEATHLKIGMEMELVYETFRVDEKGNEVVTFAFQPSTT